MNINEILLIIVVVMIFLGSKLVINQIKKPLLYYVKISAAIVLLVLVWVFGEKNDFYLKGLMSVIVLSSIFRDFFSLKKFFSDR